MYLPLIKFSHEVYFNFLGFPYVMFNSCFSILLMSIIYFNYCYFMPWILHVGWIFITRDTLQAAREGAALHCSQPRQIQTIHARFSWKEYIILWFLNLSTMKYFSILAHYYPVARALNHCLLKHYQLSSETLRNIWKCKYCTFELWQYITIFSW